MKIAKNCAHCKLNFTGRSNQLYCCDSCKIKAFQEGKTRNINQTKTEVSDRPTPATVLNQPSRVAPASSQKKSSKVDLDIRRIELEYERQLRQMDIDERERQRVHEQTLACIASEEKNQSNQLRKPTQPIDEEPQQSVARLAIWIHFPVGIRRQYKALVRAALNAAKEPMYSSTCKQWLDAYKPYSRVVDNLIDQNELAQQTNTPFVWLEMLADQIEAHRFVEFLAVEDDEQEYMLVLSPELHQHLMLACV